MVHGIMETLELPYHPLLKNKRTHLAHRRRPKILFNPVGNHYLFNYSIQFSYSLRACFDNRLVYCQPFMQSY